MDNSEHQNPNSSSKRENEHTISQGKTMSITV